MSLSQSVRGLASWLCLVVILASVSPSAQSEPLSIPNIQSAGKGYDVLYGNPRPTGGNADLGWRASVFALDYSQGSTIPTDDEVYRVPKDYEVTNVGSCHRDFSYSKLSSSFEYKKELETAASLEGGGWGASFKASADYKKVNENSQTSSTTIIESKAQCSIWDVSVVSNASPFLSENFRQAVLNLPPQHIEKNYLDFIRDFGTHYSKKVILGALAGVQVFISEEKIRRLEKENIDVEAEFKYAGGFASVSGSASYNQSVENQRKLESSMSTTESYKIGGKFIPQEETDAEQNEAWADSARERPVPINFQLEQISSMLTVAAFPEDPNIELKRDNLVLSLSTYCSYLQSSGKVADCVSKDYPIRRAGTVGGTPSQTTFSGENDWNDMGKPAIARIDVQLVDDMIGGVVALYRYGKEQRQAEGVDLGARKRTYVKEHKTWDQANLHCAEVFKSVNGHRPGRLAVAKDLTSNKQMQDVFYGEEYKLLGPTSGCFSTTPHQGYVSCTDPSPEEYSPWIADVVDRGGCPNIAGFKKYDFKLGCVPNEIWLGATLDSSNVPGDYQWNSGAPLTYNNFVTEQNTELSSSMGVVLLTDADAWAKDRNNGFVKWDVRALGEKWPFVCEDPYPTRSIDLAAGEYVTQVEVCTFNKSEGGRYQTAISSMTFETSKEHRGPEVIKANLNHDEANDACTTIDLSDRLGLLYLSGSTRKAASGLDVLQSLSFFSFKGEEQNYGDIPGFADIIPRDIVDVNASSGLGAGAIAGIVVSVIALTALLIVGGFLYRRRKAAAATASGGGGLKAAILDDDQLAKNSAGGALIGVTTEQQPHRSLPMDPHRSLPTDSHRSLEPKVPLDMQKGHGHVHLSSVAPVRPPVRVAGPRAGGPGPAGLRVSRAIASCPTTVTSIQRPPSNTTKLPPRKAMPHPPTSVAAKAPGRPVGIPNQRANAHPVAVGHSSVHTNKLVSSPVHKPPMRPPTTSKPESRNVVSHTLPTINQAKKAPTRPAGTPTRGRIALPAMVQHHALRKELAAPVVPAKDGPVGPDAKRAPARPPTAKKTLEGRARPLPPSRNTALPKTSSHGAVVEHTTLPNVRKGPVRPPAAKKAPPVAAASSVGRARPLPPSRNTAPPPVTSLAAKVPMRPTGLSGAGFHPLPPNRVPGGTAPARAPAASSSRADFVASQRAGTLSKGKQW